MTEFKKDPVFYGSMLLLYGLCLAAVLLTGESGSVFAALITAFVPWIVLALPWAMLTGVVIAIIQRCHSTKTRHPV